MSISDRIFVEFFRNANLRSVIENLQKSSKILKNDTKEKSTVPLPPRFAKSETTPDAKGMNFSKKFGLDRLRDPFSITSRRVTRLF